MRELLFDFGTTGVCGVATKIYSVFRHITQKTQGISLANDGKHLPFQL